MLGSAPTFRKGRTAIARMWFDPPPSNRSRHPCGSKTMPSSRTDTAAAAMIPRLRQGMLKLFGAGEVGTPEDSVSRLTRFRSA